jgi:hypothetical protein
MPDEFADVTFPSPEGFRKMSYADRGELIREQMASMSDDEKLELQSAQLAKIAVKREQYANDYAAWDKVLGTAEALNLGDLKLEIRRLRAELKLIQRNMKPGDIIQDVAPKSSSGAKPKPAKPSPEALRAAQKVAQALKKAMVINYRGILATGKGVSPFHYMFNPMNH